MRAVCAPRAVGYAAPTQRSSPAVSRSSWRSLHGLRERAIAASRSLEMPASSEVLPGAHTKSQRSKRSTVSSAAGSR